MGTVMWRYILCWKTNNGDCNVALYSVLNAKDEDCNVALYSVL